MITKEEISLCRQVAEKYRKEIKKGDWFNDLNVVGGNLDLCDRNADFYYKYLNENEEIIPLWTISDCLEFFTERKLRYLLQASRLDKLWINIIDDEGTNIVTEIEGEAPLEVCLKAVLAVLREKASG